MSPSAQFIAALADTLEVQNLDTEYVSEFATNWTLEGEGKKGGLGSNGEVEAIPESADTTQLCLRICRRTCRRTRHSWRWK